MSNEPDESDSVEDVAEVMVDADDAVRADKKRLDDVERFRLEAEAFWKQVFAHPIGRREMWSILHSGHAFETRFACSPSGFGQPEATWFHAGEQDFALRLFMSWQVLDPEGVLVMQREHDARFKKPERPKKRGRK